MHKNLRVALIVTACLLGCIVSQRNAIHTETNAPSPDGEDNSFGITNGMCRNVAETLLPTFTNRCDGFVDPGGIVSEYWTKDGRRVSVIYDWTGSSSADLKTSGSNRVIQLPLFIEPDKQVKDSTNRTLATSLFSAEQQPTSPADAFGAIAAFMRTYVSVINAGDTNALVKLIHPRYLACRTDETEPVYRHWFKSQFGNRIPADYMVQTHTVTTWTGWGNMEDKFYFPVPPTHWLSIVPHLGGAGNVMFVVCDTNGVFIAVACPYPNTVEHYRKLEAAH